MPPDEQKYDKLIKLEQNVVKFARKVLVIRLKIQVII
jgi:hypothetical protein